MQSISIREGSVNAALRSAIEVLKKGGIVAYPTETFYGLGVRFDREESLRKLYEIKKRPKEKAMPMIIGDMRMLDLVASVDNLRALSIIDRFWPGPLTLMLPAKDNLSKYLTAGTGSVAIRIPGQSFALELVRAAGFPITATSANISGMPPARDADTVRRYFGEGIDLLVDAGETPGGSPSTIVDLTGDNPRIVREGAIKERDIYEFIVKS
ncbi:MAG: L-threonylcarbamoyladenylate synthase [Nitrospirota bacterium]